MTAQGADLSLTAELTGAGPVEGVQVEFAALGLGGVVLGLVPVCADGVAKLESPRFDRP